METVVGEDDVCVIKNTVLFELLDNFFNDFVDRLQGSEALSVVLV